MKLFIFACTLLFLAGCVTNDFKVVDALRPGMTQTEAQAVIASYGFQRKESLNRPATGWPVERSAASLALRAGYQENRLQEKIAFAEFYPVYHGMLGYGELFLFYGEDGNLRHHYRHHIN